MVLGISLGPSKVQLRKFVDIYETYSEVTKR